jgi:hypothetical protein
MSGKYFRILSFADNVRVVDVIEFTVLLIIIIVIIITPLMEGIHTYIPETNHVSRVVNYYYYYYYYYYYMLLFLPWAVLDG